MEFKEIYRFDNTVFVEDNETSFRICFDKSYDVLIYDDIFVKSGGKPFYDEYSRYEFDKTNKNIITEIDNMLSLDNDTIRNYFSTKNLTKETIKENNLLDGHNNVHGNRNENGNGNVTNSKSLEEKVKNLNIVDQNAIDTTVQIGCYPRDLYKNIEKGILINDYTDKSIC